MRVNIQSVNPTLKGFIILTLIFIISGLTYENFDPKEIRDYGIFPWDSGEYRLIAQSLVERGFSKLEGMYPFAPRLLFPALYGGLANYLDTSYINSAYIVNICSSFFVIIFTYFFLLRNSMSQTASLTVAAIYTVFWLGPLRYANVYPGGGFAFESGIVCALFLTLQQMTKRSIFFIAFGTILIFILAIGRELVFYLMCLALILAIFITINPLKFFENQKTILTRKQLIVLSFAFLASLIGFTVSRYLVTDTFGEYSAIYTIASFGYFHLHIGEFFYPFFYALGPFFLAFLVTCSFKKSRNELIQNLLQNTREHFYVFVFIFSGIIFAMVGGTDSDRFLLWFFPFFALIGSKSLEILWVNIQIHRKLIGTLFILTTALWTRFYVPAAPHLFFPGNFYNSYAGVRTNLSPDLYFGPFFLERYRLPLKEVAVDDAYHNVIIDTPPKSREQQPFVSQKINRNHDMKLDKPYNGSYRWELNNIPFPLGFAHNQFELLVAHPHHGDKKVRLILLFQWASLYILFFMLCKRNIRES
ncbi:MAG: hypothetical protein RLY15_1474 [Bacteroidota bacterium]|jgi:hypothetical protein